MKSESDTTLCAKAAEGAEPEEELAGNYFVATYPPFSAWTEEGVAAYRAVLNSRPPGPGASPLGLYFHIPFCAKRCEFCYYLSYAGRSAGEVGKYLDALTEEATRYSALPAIAGRPIEFVYFGGGTPSLLTASQIAHLLGRLDEIFDWGEAEEMCFECAPLSVTESKLAALADAGVTRLSMGVQQLDDDVLRMNGRIHLARDAERAYEMIREQSFRTVNIDLIAGLVGETDESFAASLERVIEWAPESVTFYALEIPLNTPLYRAMNEGGLKAAVPSWDAKRARLAYGFKKLGEAGYVRRSAYASVRDPERNRFVYQESQYRGTDLLGMGVASFSYLQGSHQQNAGSFRRYLGGLADGNLPLGRAYALNSDERCDREFVLQLKLGEIREGDFMTKFGVDVGERFETPLKAFVESGWIEREGGVITLTPEGLLRADRMIPEFYSAEHRGTRYS